MTDSNTRSSGKVASKSTVKKLSEYYTIKSDGAFTLDLAKAAKSQTFKDGIKRIREQGLTVKGPAQ